MNQIISDLDMITKFESEKIDMEFIRFGISLYDNGEFSLKGKKKEVTIKFSKTTIVQ